MSTEHPELPLEQQHIDRAAAALQVMQENERAKAGRAGVGGSMRMAERALRELAERPTRAPAHLRGWRLLRAHLRRGRLRLARRAAAHHGGRGDACHQFRV